jgi:ribonuclease G
VQVCKDASGDKGARVTTKITLPGKYMVLLPGSRQASVSRRISDAGERERLKAYVQASLPDGFGLIARTEAQGADEALLSADVAELLRAWGEIRRKEASANPPECLRAGENFFAAAARRLSESDIEALIVDDAPAYEALTLCAAPADAGKIRLHSGPHPLFDLHGIQGDVKSLSARKVWLKCGAHIVIDRTEALTAIDVNSGKYSGKSDPEDTIRRVNTEAAVEAARQLRLRDIGGVIVIDLIRMAGQEHYAPVIAALEAELAKDPRKSSVAGITRLGLLEMTRKHR